MEQYRDIGGDSGVTAYEYGDDWIIVKFKSGGTYKYTASQIGGSHLATMKRLADSGDGLNAYINTNAIVKHGYSKQL